MGLAHFISMPIPLFLLQMQKDLSVIIINKTDKLYFYMHKFLSSILKNHNNVRHKKNTCASVTDFLKQHDSMSGMLPNAERIVTLQKNCEQILPEYFSACKVLQLNDEKLTISVPNQATAARLRQKLAFLQTGLEKSGWPVKTVRVKVKPREKSHVVAATQKEPLSQQAVEELAKLEEQLTKSGTDPVLMNALQTMMKRHQKNPG